MAPRCAYGGSSDLRALGLRNRNLRNRSLTVVPARHFVSYVCTNLLGMAKPELRALAEALRKQGLSVPAIAAELGVARSTAFRGPSTCRAKVQPKRCAPQSPLQSDDRLPLGRAPGHGRSCRDPRRSAAEVGRLSDRELLLVGAAIYWSEGTKAKPWRPNDWRMTFTNSDVGCDALPALPGGARP